MITKRIAPVFAVSNLDAALEHYKDVLGFSNTFRVGNYAGVALGAIGLHLTESEDTNEKREHVGKRIAYIFCDEVDSYYSDIVERGAQVSYPPKDWPYGMREFMVTDLDGNKLVFGCDIAED